MYTYVKPSRDNADAFFVETWYDRTNRYWATQLKNANLDQVGSVVWTARKPAAFKNHQQIVNSLSDGMPYIIENFRK